MRDASIDSVDAATPPHHSQVKMHVGDSEADAGSVFPSTSAFIRRDHSTSPDRTGSSVAVSASISINSPRSHFTVRIHVSLSRVPYFVLIVLVQGMLPDTVILVSQLEVTTRVAHSSVITVCVC